MSYEGLIEYGGVEVINVARTAALADTLGIHAVRTTPQQTAWITESLGGQGYGDITKAPWYDAGTPASMEFAGLMPLSIAGLDDSTLETSVIEYLGDGGKTGGQRQKTLTVVGNGMLCASTQRGAEYGKRWLDALLRGARRIAQTRVPRTRKNMTTGVNNSLDRAYIDGGATLAIRPDGAIRGTRPSGGATDIFSIGWNITGTKYAVAVPGRRYTVSATLRSSKPGSQTFNLRFFTSAGATISSPSKALTYVADTPTRETVTAIAPANAAFVAYYAGTPATATANDFIEIKDALLEESTDADLGYFDGNSVGDFSGQYTWEGTALASASIKTLDQRVGRFVPGEGAPLTYFAYEGSGAPLKHRNKTNISRGLVVTNKRSRSGSVLWTTTWTWTCDDPYEYGDGILKVASLGAVAGATGAGVLSSGNAVLTETACPEYNYAPFYDPQFPALVPAPAPPDFLPDGWAIESGQSFRRTWARISVVEPSTVPVVPKITLTNTVDARMVRVGVWPADAPNDSQCNPLFIAILTYVPAELTLWIDGETRACYAWDGASIAVRRADSLIYGPNASPVRWTAFNESTELLVVMDVFAKPGGGYQGDDTVRAGVSLVPKAD